FDAAQTCEPSCGCLSPAKQSPKPFHKPIRFNARRPVFAFNSVPHASQRYLARILWILSCILEGLCDQLLRQVFTYVPPNPSLLCGQADNKPAVNHSPSEFRLRA
ncbi:hypothetical protein PQR06_33880, partial [Paraburkholderia graminis]|uniref:hypothetical protein n=1 Tax=Paraburkholderia graminis TaxID=60548 RepID=UPI0038BCDA56